MSAALRKQQLTFNQYTRLVIDNNNTNNNNNFVVKHGKPVVRGFLQPYLFVHVGAPGLIFRRLSGRINTYVIHWVMGTDALLTVSVNRRAELGRLENLSRTIQTNCQNIKKICIVLIISRFASSFYGLSLKQNSSNLLFVSHILFTQTGDLVYMNRICCVVYDCIMRCTNKGKTCFYMDFKLYKTFYKIYIFMFLHFIISLFSFFFRFSSLRNGKQPY